MTFLLVKINVPDVANIVQKYVTVIGPDGGTRIINDIFNKEILKRKLSTSENVLGKCS